MTTSKAIDECPPSPSTSSASASSCSLLSARDENNTMMRGNGGKGVGAGGEPRKSVAGLCLVILTPSLGGFLYGYDIGATSFVLSMLNAGSKARGDGSDDDAYAGYDGGNGGCYWWDDFSSRHFQMGIMVSAMSFGALVSSHLIYHCFGTRQMSRRMELRVAAALYVLGSLCNVLSGTVFAAVASAATAEETAPAAELSGFPHHHHHHHQGGGSGSGDRYHDFGVDDPDGCAAAAGAGPGLGWYVIVLGRLLYGMGVGFVMHGAPTYLAEMSPSSIRGAVVSSKETVIVLGVTTGYAIGNAVSSMISDGGQQQQQGQNRWTYLYGASLCLSVPMLVLSFCIPRSKRWLIMHGLYDEAEESMTFVYADHPDVVRDEFEKLSTSMRANQARYLYERQPCSTLADDDDDHRAANRLFSAPVRPALTAAMGLILFQQISGQPSVLSYAAVLFDASGWGGNACTISAVFMLCVSSCTVALVDRLGRRRHLLTCVTAMSLAALTLAACFWDWAGPDDDSAEARDDDDVHVHDPSSSSLSPLVSVTVLLSMFLYIGGYQIGFGPITWLLVSEMFPGDVRGPATALGVELNYLLNFVVQFLVPVLQDRLGWGRTFALFGAVMIAAFGFVFHYVPETAGKTLEQIEEELLTHKHGVVGDDDRRKPAFPPTETTPFLPALPGATETTASRAV